MSKTITTPEMLAQFTNGASGTQIGTMLLGFKLAMFLKDDIDVAALLSTDRQPEQLQIIRDTLEHKHNEEKRIEKENTAAILKTIMDNATPDQLEHICVMMRGFFLNRNKVNNDGLACNNKGKVQEDENFQPITGETIAPWPIYNIVSKTDGNIIDEGAYKSMTAGQKKDYEFQPYFQLDVPGESPRGIFNDTKDADYFVPFITMDMQKHPGIALRYALELVNDPKRDKVGSMTRFRATVIRALESTGKLEFQSKAVLTQLERGYIGSMQELKIAFLEALAQVPDFTIVANPGDIDRYLDLVEVACDSDLDVIKAAYPDDAVDNYKDADGKPLRGRENTGTDQNPRWKIKTMGVARSEQWQYIKYLGEEIIKKIFQRIVDNGEINPDKATEQSARIMELYTRICLKK